MGEIKQANFRIDTDTADKFRAFCEEHGLNQAQGFEHLMDVLALNNAKETVPGRLTEIEDVEYHVKAIITAYLSSLQLAQDAETRAKESFQELLMSKDKTIMDLQIKLDGQKEKIAAAAKEKEEAAVKTASDKNAINEMLNAKLIDAESKLNGFEELRASEEKLKNELAKAKSKVENTVNK